MTEQKRFGYIFGGFGSAITSPFSSFYSCQLGINMNISDTSSFRFKTSESQDNIPSVAMSLRAHGKERTYLFTELSVVTQTVPNTEPHGVFSLGFKYSEKGSNPLFSETSLFARTDGTLGFQTMCGVEWDL